ncbi:unnamed protein product [Lactuca virosa]|uniref:Cucumisin n=1 Tax=Lactuca virosa TaxID=75947 RepID=A0AAU9M791_9ASTR|nr:unnamed protein product [Lactuca virosa]
MKMMNVVWTCIVLISLVILVSSIDEDRKVFIAYMGFLPEGEYSPSLHHYEILKNITNPRFARKPLIRSYQRSFNGFAAYLSQEEQQNLAGFDGIISVFPCQKLHLQTTRSWDFMGFPTTIERSPTAESDTIIEIIDGGIWPESESFSDEGLGPIPTRWKGECQGGTNFTCNRKIIGARYYGIEYSVRDMHGHGTHVASTIAGRQGNSINAFPSSNEELPLLYGKQVTSECSENEASYCHAKCLDGSLVEHKVVLCDENRNPYSVKAAGASGCIVPNHGNSVSEVGPLPIAALNTNDINLVKTYQNSSIKPKVQIFKSEAINNQVAPLVASFSSRGPSRFIYDIIKPDVTAPGVEILAAYSPMAPPSHTYIDKRSVKYNILSGTSMACPHVAAAAAFVKSFHPNWSPSAIKSALMTTAWEMIPYRSLDTEFAYGSGHIDPHKAKDPGLVYDTSKEDYHKIWCRIFQSILNTTCDANLTLRQMNYPSMAVQVGMNSAFVVSFPRTVTNVGKANSTYVASIKGSTKLNIIVDPNILQFTALNQRKSFVVTVRGKRIKSPLTVESVSLLWTDEDDIHKVRSPIVVYTGNTTNTTSSDQRGST